MALIFVFVVGTIQGRRAEDDGTAFEASLGNMVTPARRPQSQIDNHHLYELSTNISSSLSSVLRMHVWSLELHRNAIYELALVSWLHTLPT